MQNSGGDDSKMLAEDNDAFEGIGRVDTLDDEFESDMTATFGVSDLVGERMHDEDTLAGSLVVGEVAIARIIEAYALVGHLGIDAATASAESDGDGLVGSEAVAVYDSIVDSLEDSNADGGVVAPDIAVVAEMEQTLLDDGQTGLIGLYNKCFYHNRLGIFRLQIYRKIPT